MSAIGVFDSGVGGITVLRELKRRWPGEDFIYLADTARLPYGSKSPTTIRKYAEQNIHFLMGQAVKAVVIACNSASTAVLDTPISCSVPVFNVIQPGARKAVELSRGLGIGVLGTRATVISEAYPQAIRKFNRDIPITQQPCPLWVPLVEEGWINDPITNLIVYRYVSPLMQQTIDTIVLGCTHYPALINSIRRACGESIQLVDSSIGLIEDLEKSGICDAEPSTNGRLELMCTDFSPRLEDTFNLLLDGIAYDCLETVTL